MSSKLFYILLTSYTNTRQRPVPMASETVCSSPEAVTARFESNLRSHSEQVTYSLAQRNHLHFQIISVPSCSSLPSAFSIRHQPVSWGVGGCVCRSVSRCRGGAASARLPDVPRGRQCVVTIRMSAFGRLIVMGLNHIGVNTSLEKALKLIHNLRDHLLVGNDATRKLLPLNFFSHCQKCARFTRSFKARQK